MGHNQRDEMRNHNVLHIINAKAEGKKRISQNIKIKIGCAILELDE